VALRAILDNTSASPMPIVRLQDPVHRFRAEGTAKITHWIAVEAVKRAVNA
jgi:hypothetical protein